MVKNNWNQTTKNDKRLVWVNNITNQVISVQEQTTVFNELKNKGKWIVMTGKMNGYATTEKIDVPKKDALRFARSYMKKHNKR